MQLEVGRPRDLGVLLAFLAVVGVAMYVNREPPFGTRPDLARELLAMQRADQRVRNASIDLGNGTQFTCRAGRHTPQPIADQVHVYARRARMGLDPLADAIRRQVEVYGPCPDPSHPRN